MQFFIKTEFLVWSDSSMCAESNAWCKFHEKIGEYRFNGTWNGGME